MIFDCQRLRWSSKRRPKTTGGQKAQIDIRQELASQIVKVNALQEELASQQVKFDRDMQLVTDSLYAKNVELRETVGHNKTLRAELTAENDKYKKQHALLQLCIQDAGSKTTQNEAALNAKINELEIKLQQVPTEYSLLHCCSCLLYTSHF